MPRYVAAPRPPRAYWDETVGEVYDRNVTVYDTEPDDTGLVDATGRSTGCATPSASCRTGRADPMTFVCFADTLPGPATVQDLERALVTARMVMRRYEHANPGARLHDDRATVSLRPLADGSTEVRVEAQTRGQG